MPYVIYMHSVTVPELMVSILVHNLHQSVASCTLICYFSQVFFNPSLCVLISLIIQSRLHLFLSIRHAPLIPKPRNPLTPSFPLAFSAVSSFTFFFAVFLIDGPPFLASLLSVSGAHVMLQIPLHNFVV